MADYADNPGSGAYGDATGLISALLGVGVNNACFGPLIDPEAAAFLNTQTVGATVTLCLGGKTAPAFCGGPLELTGTVTRATGALSAAARSLAVLSAALVRRRYCVWPVSTS